MNAQLTEWNVHVKRTNKRARKHAPVSTPAPIPPVEARELEDRLDGMSQQLGDVAALVDVLQSAMSMQSDPHHVTRSAARALRVVASRLTDVQRLTTELRFRTIVGA